jgi:signal transduction histidine kinase
MGLYNMRERAEKLQGAFQIESTPQQGVKIRVTIPIHAHAEKQRILR